ncbi:MAG: hypothetical protein AAGJ93_15455 [Bacteroidota bacterium]
MKIRLQATIYLLLFTLSLNAQSGIVVGINGQYLVRVNLETAALKPLSQIANLPDGEELRNLVYVAKDKALYSTLYTKTKPTLVRIQLDGSWEEVGLFTYGDGAVPYFCEALSYNEETDQLILAASLDGAISRDKKSESLLVVNRSDASCYQLASIRQGIAPDDFDEIAFFRNYLFCLDGTPGINNTYVFPFATDRLTGILFSGTKQNIPYFTMDDVMTMGQLLYFPHTQNGHLYRYDLMARKWSQVAQLQGPSLIGKIKLTGLAFVPLEQA